MAEKKTFADFVPESFKQLAKKYIKEYKEKFDLPATAPATPPTATQSGTLQDGTQVTWDTPTLAVGSNVSVVNPDGSGVLPIPDGEYVMQDGTQITCVSGKVTEIETPAQASTEPAGMAQPGVPGDPNAPANGTDENPNTEKRLQALEAAVKQMQGMMGAPAAPSMAAQYSAQFASNKKEIEELKALVKQQFELIENLLDLPSADPIQTPANATVKKSKAELALEKFINRKIA